MLPMLGMLLGGITALALALWLTAKVEVGDVVDTLAGGRRTSVIVSGLALAMVLKIGLVGVGFFVTGYVAPVVLFLGVAGGVFIWGVVVPQV